MKMPLVLSLVVLAAGCAGTRKLVDPTVTVLTERGQELGVSTEYGVVFLGHTARSGDVDLVAWYDDGPSIESTIIEAVGEHICTAETEIRLPWVPLTFQTPKPGDSVLVMGRRGRERWQVNALVVSDPAVTGLLLEPDGGLPLEIDQVGAGVYVVGDDEQVDWWCAGLVSGYLDVEREGVMHTYLTVIASKGLQDLVTYHRHDPLERRWVYREDIF